MSWYPGKFIERVLGGYRGQEQALAKDPARELLRAAEALKRAVSGVGVPMQYPFTSLSNSLSIIKRINEENVFGQDEFVEKMEFELSELVSHYDMVSRIKEDADALIRGIINDMQRRMRRR
jgi:hypothetical protein